MREHDKPTVDKWITYLESKPHNENGKKIVDQFSFEDSANHFYNAVHHAVVDNDVEMLEKLCRVDAGAVIHTYTYNMCRMYNIVTLKLCTA